MSVWINKHHFQASILFKIIILNPKLQPKTGEYWNKLPKTHAIKIKCCSKCKTSLNHAKYKMRIKDSSTGKWKSKTVPTLSLGQYQTKFKTENLINLEGFIRFNQDNRYQADPWSHYEASCNGTVDTVRSKTDILINDWESGNDLYDDLIYMMFTLDSDRTIPLYICKTETSEKTNKRPNGLRHCSLSPLTILSLEKVLKESEHFKSSVL